MTLSFDLNLFIYLVIQFKRFFLGYNLFLDTTIASTLKNLPKFLHRNIHFSSEDELVLSFADKIVDFIKKIRRKTFFLLPRNGK